MLKTKPVPFPVAPAQMGSRRRTIRVAASHIKAFATAQLLPVRVEDLSDGGFSAISPISFETNSVHVVRLTLGRVSVTTRGRVLHCRRTENNDGGEGYVTGFAFVGHPRPDSSTLDELLDAITTSAVSFDFS
jgi:hypothetical protein